MSEQTYSLALDDNIIGQGDDTSIKVVYNNLTGRNFENPPVWRTQSHAEYLAMMEREWGVTLSPGKQLSLHSGNEMVASHTLSVSPATHFSKVAPI